ncbi:MAG TPA: cation:proton antiporter [Sporichthyaceae bacterium]
MNDAARFGLIVAGFAGVGLAALLVNLVSARIRVPAPALLLAAAAVGVHVASGSGPVPDVVEHTVSLALVVILLDGGMHIGRSRLRPVIVPVLALGLLGTLLTTVGICAVAEPLLGLGWYAALLLGAALAPTDPAVVFSVFSDASAEGHAVTVLEGESGANDPVGIAVMSGLIGAGGVSGSALTDAAGHVVGQLVGGLAGGLIGGFLVLALVRRIGAIDESRYPLLVTIAGFAIFGLISAAHGSGFLAVFVAGIVMGDKEMPSNVRTRQFLGALSGLGEIVAFVLLGLTVDLNVIGRADVLWPGLALGAASALVIRPLACAPWLLRSRLSAGERVFVLWAGLKGAVPVLLGTFLLSRHVADAERLYGIVVVVVMFSVVVQGSSVPLVARWTGVRAD